jgi:hypothetical protein
MFASVQIFDIRLNVHALSSYLDRGVRSESQTLPAIPPGSALASMPLPRTLRVTGTRSIASSEGRIHAAVEPPDREIEQRGITNPRRIRHKQKSRQPIPRPLDNDEAGDRKEKRDNNNKR